MKMTEKFDFDGSSCVLLDSNPQKASQVVQKSHGSSSATLQELQSNIDQNPIPPEVVRDRKRVDDFLVVEWDVDIDDTAEDQ